MPVEFIPNYQTDAHGFVAEEERRKRLKLKREAVPDPPNYNHDPYGFVAEEERREREAAALAANQQQAEKGSIVARADAQPPIAPNASQPGQQSTSQLQPDEQAQIAALVKTAPGRADQPGYFTPEEQQQRAAARLQASQQAQQPPTQKYPRYKTPEELEREKQEQEAQPQPAPAALPAPETPPAQRMPRYLTPQEQQSAAQQQETPMAENEAAAKDASYLPASERAARILDGLTPASDVMTANAQPGAAPASAAETAPALSSTPSVKPTGAPQFEHTGDYLKDSDNYIKALSAYRPEDHNGHWKSMALSAVRLFLHGLAGGNIGQALGAAIFGAAYGAFHPSFDEEFAKQHNLTKAQKERAATVAREMESLHVRDARASVASKEAGLAGGNDAKQQAKLIRELKDRMKLTGNSYDPNDARQAEITQALNIKPRAAKTGSSINPQRIKNINAGGRDHLVYVDFGDDGQLNWRLIEPDGEQSLTPDASRELQNAIQNEISLGRLNIDRAHIGQAPVQINPAIAKPQFSLPTQKYPTYKTTPAKTDDGKPQVAQPSSSVLVPTGEKAPALPLRGYGGGGSSYHRGGSGGGDTKGASFTLSKINDLARRAAEKEDEGDPEAAARLRAEAEQERETARRMHSGQIQVNVDGTASWKGSKGSSTGRPKLKVPWITSPLRGGRAAEGRQ